MDRQYIREHQVIERYLSGALTADEEQGFEEAYLGDAELLDQLQAAERLRDGIKGLDGAGDLERSRPRWRQTFASPRYAMAATVLLAVSLGFSSVLYRENEELRETALPSASLLTQLIPLASTRGGNDTAITAPGEDEWVVFQVDAGGTEYDTYRAVLERRDGAQAEEIWRRADLKPTRGEISIGVSGSALRPGQYEVRVGGRMNDSPAGRFDEVSSTRFNIIPRD